MNFKFAMLLQIAIALMPSLTFAGQPGEINVQDYGAKGDGVTDDTNSIRLALQAAAIKISKPGAGGSHYQAGPALVFPSGEYLVSDEINIVGCLEIYGRGGTVIKQLNKSKNIFVSQHAWKLRLSNLTFVDGNDQLHLYQPNVDAGEIFIEHCKFLNSAGTAIYADVLSETVKIEDCQFLDCEQSWRNIRCDQAIMKDCWITNRRSMKDKPVIEHSGQRMTVENLAGVSLVTPGNNQRWFDNNGSNLTLKQIRFGGEEGGFTPVYNIRKYRPIDSKAFDGSMGVNIIMDDCFIVCGNDKDARSAVFCKEVPNSIIIQNSVFASGCPVMLDPKIDLDTYFTNVQKQRLLFKCCNNTAISDKKGPVSANKMPGGLENPKVDNAKRPIIPVKETEKALKSISKDLIASQGSGTNNGHAQKTNSDDFVDITSTIFKDGKKDLEIAEYRGLLRTKCGLIAFMRSDEIDPKELVFKAKIDLDKYPWLTWIQREGNTFGSFTVEIKDVETGKKYTISPYAIYDNVYDYRAENIKKLTTLSGVKEFEVSWWTYGWDKNPKKDKYWDSMWAWPGQYTILEFVRFEKD